MSLLMDYYLDFNYLMDGYNDYKWLFQKFVSHSNLEFVSFVIPDNESLSYMLHDGVKSFDFIFDTSSVVNNSEYFATSVGKYLVNKELNTDSAYSGIITHSGSRDFYTFFNWVDKLFDTFYYKYIWLDVDFFGDYAKFNRFESLSNFDDYEPVILTNESFDSYLFKDFDLLYVGEKRMLEVDNRLVIPSKTHVQFIVTSADVIHSFAVPAFGIKIDAIPGRLNQCFVFVKYEGTFFGQCSEICGVDHGFMPIVIDVVNYSYYQLAVRSYVGWESDAYYKSGWEDFLSAS